MTDLLTVRNTILILFCIALLIWFLWLAFRPRPDQRPRPLDASDDDTDDYNWITTTTRAELQREDTTAPGWWPRRRAS